MIASLRLKNFKPFPNQFLEFKPLTLLSGLNNSGKSSILQALLLLRQSYQQGLLPNKGLALNGDLVCIGTAQDALFEGAKEDCIGFEISLKNGSLGVWNFRGDRSADVLNLTSPPVADNIYKSSLFNNDFHYLQAERIGPRPFLEMSDFQVKELKQLGTKGEYAAHFLFLKGREIIPNKALKHREAKSADLIDQVEAWMGEISPGTRLNIEPKLDVDLMNFQYSYGDSNGSISVLNKAKKLSLLGNRQQATGNRKKEVFSLLSKSIFTNMGCSRQQPLPSY